ncbi:YegP family protein [Novosphingobium sp. M1R2S20]|uniref:YegP family protein n=1 Tax=Novosphingobium rhizovicinum TaxID=3228928 RepID=A0ABV3RBW5_9SPHN
MAELNRVPLEGSSSRLGRIGDQTRPAGEPKVDGQCQFELYCEDHKGSGASVIRWRWRLCSSSGAVLAQSGSYETDAECLAAISALRNFAASARLIRQE